MTDSFTYIIQHLNSHPYSLTKDECVDYIKTLRDSYTKHQQRQVVGIVYQHGYRPVGRVYRRESNSNKARLQRAALDLLEALERLVRVSNREWNEEVVANAIEKSFDFDFARAAIAKATGEPK